MITFLGDVALIDDNLKSVYKPANPYVFNLEYVAKNEKDNLLPTLGKINLSSENKAFASIFGKLPLAVCVSNNHIFDYGERGYRTTIENMSKLGVATISNKPVIISENLCFISFMYFKGNELFQFKYEEAKENIQNVRKDNPDMRIVVQMHWGIENSPIETREQKEVAHWLIDNGVDLVIGHHPHCLQSVEKYKEKIIFYSLGNALFGNICVQSHYDHNYIPQRIYRFKWQSWNRKTIAVNYDEKNNAVESVDCLYQRKNNLICKKENVSLDKIIKKKIRFSKIKFYLRKYFLFFASNIFVDGKLFDLSAIKHELRRK